MSRYIEEKDVYKLVEPNGVARVHCSQIDDLPRADVVEVRHGRWELGKSGLMYFCSFCGYAAHPREEEQWNFCPNCGAKMDGGERR